MNKWILISKIFKFEPPHFKAAYGPGPFAIAMEAWEAAMEDIFLQDTGAEVDINLDEVGTPEAWWLCIWSWSAGYL